MHSNFSSASVVAVQIAIVICCLCCSFNLFAQKAGSTQIEIVNANTLEGKRVNGKEIRRLIGDVVFKQDDVMMYCDSAYQYAAENRMDAFGKVRINQGDSLKLFGKLLKYDGNKRVAVMFDNIRMTDGKMTMTSDNLTYKFQNKSATYVNGGKIVDKQNVLTSRTGTYFSSQKTFLFIDSVVLTNPEYILKTDTLRYNTNKERAYFLGPCTMKSRTGQSTTMYCEEGWYDSKSKISIFKKNCYILSGTQVLKGDSIYYNQINAVGKSFGNVSVIDTSQNLSVSGDYGEYYERENYSLITGNALLKQSVENDTLFLHADTLYAKNDSLRSVKEYYAFHHVKIYKEDLQGMCDSLVYRDADSSISFYGYPIIWSAGNQLTADFIKMQLANNQVSELYLDNEAFIASQEVVDKYNQVRGKNMIGYFRDNELRKIDVSGNGQTIYYAVNDKKKLIGVNRADCSDLVIYVKDNKVDRITLIEEPEATFYPPNELKPGELLLKGFSWQVDKRPLQWRDVFLWE